MTFGEFVKSKRLQSDSSLREFCKTAELDPSNWSKVERGLLQAPSDRTKLEAIARDLN